MGAAGFSCEVRAAGCTGERSGVKGAAARSDTVWPWNAHGFDSRVLE